MTSDPVLPPSGGELLWRPPRWASPVTLLISILGIGVAAYLTYVHYTDPRSLACSDSGVINCTRVTTSEQSKLLGIPVALLGLLYFVGMAVLSLPQVWRRPERAVRIVRVTGVVVGVAMIIYLIAAELFVIEAICLWCTVVHVLAFLLFVAVVAATMSGIQRPLMDDFEEFDDVEDDEGD